RRRHTRSKRDWSSDVCSSDLHHVVQSAAIENSAVNAVMFLVRDVKPGVVDVKRVRILHDELPHPQQSRLRTWFVAKLGLNLIPRSEERRVGKECRTRWWMCGY